MADWYKKLYVGKTAKDRSEGSGVRSAGDGWRRTSIL